MSFLPCPRCATPILPAMTSCPHCHAAADADGEAVRGLPALLMGLLLAGCGDKDDTGDTAAEDTAAGAALYGVAVSDVEDGASGQSSSTTSKHPKS